MTCQPVVSCVSVAAVDKDGFVFLLNYDISKAIRSTAAATTKTATLLQLAVDRIITTKHNMLVLKPGCLRH